ncbi:hypothetical protein ACFQQB_04900 [Nonomuraea rubra]|uniref:hypothetical protein n=1 Tax=Nonomuraea rubra TaxID=46180 RepID=UPI003622B937
MPMEDVGRLLDTLDEGFAEATGEQPAVPAHDPGTEVMPGTGTYHRPQQHSQQPPQLDERPTAALSPNDVLVARGPAPQDKLVASYGETTAPRDTTPAYGEPRTPFTGPQYVESTGPQPKYTGDPFSGPQYTSDPLSGPQYTADPLSGPHYTQQPPQAEPFTGPQYVDGSEPVYQLPGADQRRQSPLSTDPLGFPSQAAEPYQQQQPYQQDPYSSDPYGNRRSDGYQQAPPQPQPSAAGLGTPMHGIPGRAAAAPRPSSRSSPPRTTAPTSRARSSPTRWTRCWPSAARSSTRRRTSTGRTSTGRTSTRSSPTPACPARTSGTPCSPRASACAPSSPTTTREATAGVTPRHGAAGTLSAG